MARILVVEDSPTQATEMRMLLEATDHTVAVAGDGVEALRSVRADAPDLIVTDLVMPSMDGVALVEAVRHDFPFIPVVLVTAYGSEEIAARALRAGAASYVPKRNISLDLVDTITDILEYSRVVVDHREAVRTMTRLDAEFLVENDPAVIPAVVRYLERGLSGMGVWDPADVLRVGVAVHEALMNAIAHGNLEMGSPVRRQADPDMLERVGQRRANPPYCDRRVHLNVRVSPVEATYVIRDDGPGFDTAGLPDPLDTSGMADDSGRGLVLIRTFMDDVSHNARGNEITLKRRKPTGGAAD